MSAITMRDIEARLERAREAYSDYIEAGHGFTSAEWHVERRKLLAVVESWVGVRNRVRAGEDPLLAVMSRE